MVDLSFGSSWDTSPVKAPVAYTPTCFGKHINMLAKPLEWKMKQLKIQWAKKIGYSITMEDWEQWF